MTSNIGARDIKNIGSFGFGGEKAEDRYSSLKNTVEDAMRKPDHIGGAAEIADALNPLPLVALHPDDHVLWRAGGGASLFGFHIDPGPEPSIDLSHGQILRLGNSRFEVRYTPGHSPGHCVFYCAEAGVCFSGDLIVATSAGRSDLPGGDWDTLEKSIREQIYTLPDETRLLSGHGPETTVAYEKQFNPFVSGSTP